jgi:hypothetical protein
MRTKQVIQGLNNSQKIRVIINGVGFHTTVMGMTEMLFTDQRVAVWNALDQIAREGVRGVASRTWFYNDKMEKSSVDYQVDLC